MMKQTNKKTPAKARTSTKKRSAPKPSVVKVANKKPTTQRKRVPVKRRDIFAGASEISMTENKIAVTRSVANSSKGGYTESTVRTYHDKTPANMRALDEVMRRKGVKKVTVKLK